MIVLDLDGTLLNNKKTISDKDVYILNYLFDTGVKIAIATGRNYYMAKKLIHRIADINPIIFANNGAVVRKYQTDELIDYNYLSYEDFKCIYNYGLNYNLSPVIHIDDYNSGTDIVYEKDNFEDVYLGYITKDDVRAKKVQFTSNELEKILSVCYLDNYDRLEYFADEINKLYSGKVNIICNRNISKRGLLEFLNINSCKWLAVKKYCKSVNISTDEIMAFGDDNNDIEIIKNSGLGIAMKNATEFCKIAAKKITKYDNNNSGISYELINLFNL